MRLNIQHLSLALRCIKNTQVHHLTSINRSSTVLYFTKTLSRVIDVSIILTLIKIYVCLFTDVYDNIKVIFLLREQVSIRDFQKFLANICNCAVSLIILKMIARARLFKLIYYLLPFTLSRIKQVKIYGNTNYDSVLFTAHSGKVVS